jgi:hypothetical protein
MPSEDFFYRQNEFVVGAVFLIALLAAGELGHQLGRRSRRDEVPAWATHPLQVDRTIASLAPVAMRTSDIDQPL